MSQVALNWCIAKDVIPIPGARNKKQAIDNCNTLNWSLNEERNIEPENTSGANLYVYQ